MQGEDELILDLTLAIPLSPAIQQKTTRKEHYKCHPTPLQIQADK